MTNGHRVWWIAALWALGSGREAAGQTTADAAQDRPHPAALEPQEGSAQALVSIVAMPGGTIEVDGAAQGRDTTSPLPLTPGAHQVRIVSRFLGTHTTTIEVAAGQRGVVAVIW